jgi:prepilin-type N-terminal cleavage/methylation domain-containing protein
MAQQATTTSATGSNVRRPEPLGPGTPRRPRWSALRGLTLIEVLVSVAILAAGAVVVMQALARGAHALATARHRATAYAFSAAKLADLQQQLDQGALEKTSGRFGTGAARFDWHVDAAPLADAEDLELVTLTVAWRQGRHDDAQHFSLVHRLPEARP